MNRGSRYITASNGKLPYFNIDGKRKYILHVPRGFKLFKIPMRTLIEETDEEIIEETTPNIESNNEISSDSIDETDEETDEELTTTEPTSPIDSIVDTDEELTTTKPTSPIDSIVDTDEELTTTTEPTSPISSIDETDEEKENTDEEILSETSHCELTTTRIELEETNNPPSKRQKI